MPAKKSQDRSSGQKSIPVASSKNPDEILYPVPKDSAAAWNQLKRAQNTSLNVGLIFERFVQNWGWHEQRYRDKEAKQNAWKEIAGISSRADKRLLDACHKRWSGMRDAVNATELILKTDWRFITGLGRKGPLEAGFTFHRYGFPILPGSSVKGIARAYAFYQLAEVLQPQDLIALDKLLSEDDEKKYREGFDKYFSTASQDARTQADQFRAIFGTTNNAGRAIFLDAIPTRVPSLELDIMNPHFPKYYQGDEFPTDWQSPNPVFFLTVAPNTEFRFAVGWRGAQDEQLRARAQEWLTKGLTELGAGAKTSAGYGYFKADGAAEQKAQAVQAAQTAAPAQPAQPVRPSTRHTAIGKIRYESGKPYVRSEEGKRWRVNWKELGMESLKEKTVVEIEYDEFEDGTHKVVRVTKKGG